MINQIKSGQLILKNIGSFKIVSKNERQGRNPKTKEEFIIPARKSVLYSSSNYISTELKQK